MKHRKAYIINKVTEDKFQLCKVLNTYNSNTEASHDLKELLTNKKSEDDMLKEFDKKEL